jgi:hypothetical protein
MVAPQFNTGEAVLCWGETALIYPMFRVDRYTSPALEVRVAEEVAVEREGEDGDEGEDWRCEEEIHEWAP